MSWVTVIWSMVASACLTLAIMQFLVWFLQRTAWANLLFSLSAVTTAGMAGCEFWMMRAETPAQFATALRWIHVSAWVIIVTLVGFVLVHLRAGRRWLALTVCALRTFTLMLNFLVGQNLNYIEVTRLRTIPFLDESVSVADGVSNPLMLVGQLSLVLFLVFVVDAAIIVWRRGDRRRALVMGGSIVFFVLAGTVQSMLVLWQIVQLPLTLSLLFMGIVAAMGYEMIRETLRAAHLADDLCKKEGWLNLARIPRVWGYGYGILKPTTYGLQKKPVCVTIFHRADRYPLSNFFPGYTPTIMTGSSRPHGSASLNKQIAYDLGIHERTVKLHRTAIMNKLGVHSAAQLTKFWMEISGLEG
jgi:hypothetical protein